MERKEAIEVIKKNWPDSSFTILREALETLIPEIKESEDERIRKWIKKELENKYVEDGIVNNVLADKAFAWLEEQKHLYETAKDRFYLEGFEEGQLYEKQKEQKPTEWSEEDEKIRKKLLSAFKGIMDDADIDELWYGLTYNDILAWLEKQGKQNPCEACEEARLNCQNFPCERKKIFDSSEKVKPKKFKVGDWVIGGIICNEARQIAEVKKDGYVTTYPGWIGSAFEEDYRLWTIKDAKDGDVLIKSNKPFIYNGNYDCSYIGSYCGISVEGKFTVSTKRCFWTGNSNIYPATKEQRDTLMKAMSDAGYTFDFDKKELKKIEQKSTWSEEDERTYKSIIYSFNYNYPLTIRQQEFIKSLKGRITWKPTEPQLVSLTIACDRNDRVGFELTQLLQELKKL